jgi:hypothetical protein
VSIRPASFLAAGIGLGVGLGVMTGCGEELKPPPPPPTQLAIRVLDGVTGAPIEGAEVMLLEDGRVETTDASGGTLFALTSGRYGYRIQAAGHVSVPRPGRPIPSADVAAERTTSIMVAVEPRPGAAPGGTLAGQVTKGGSPVKGVLVVAESTESFGTISDAQGRYTMLGIAANLYTVSAFLRGHASAPKNNVQVSAGPVSYGRQS